MSNFWAKLEKPFLVLAPMEDVTDYAFREVLTHLPSPDVYFTEFTSADGLNSRGREVTIQKLKKSTKQKPVVAQIWGIHAENMFLAAKLVKELGFDGVDINMGCPVKKITKTGAGAAHCLNPELAKEIIQATQEGAKGIPISVKTRLGFNQVITDEWIPFLLKLKPHALTLHGRTAKQGSEGDANWHEIGRAAQMRDEISPDTIFIGNGDVKNYTQAKELCEKYNVDGAMIGRGVFANPWVFEKGKQREHSQKEYLDTLLLHLDLYEKTWGTKKSFDVMKKFFKMYVNNFENASQMRNTLMGCKTYEEVRTLVKEIQKKI